MLLQVIRNRLQQSRQVILQVRAIICLVWVQLCAARQPAYCAPYACSLLTACQRRHRMRTPNVFSILSTDSKDLAERTLGLLPLAALGSLSCTCKTLRASVAAAPTAWRAAAERQLPPKHPATRALSIRGYLQQQHMVCTNLARRHCFCAQRTFPSAPW